MTAPAPDPSHVAVAQQDRTARLSRTVVDRAGERWQQIDPANLDASWSRLVPGLVEIVAAGQLLAAAQAQEYLDLVDDDPAAPRINPAGFSGTSADGRPLDSLLTLPAGTALAGIAAGLPVAQALAGGRLQLLEMAQTEVADAGRVATGAGVTAHPRLHGYVRVVNPPACGRCVLLAGRVYRWSTGFQRHPRCDCGMRPVDSPEAQLQATPEQLFRAMTPAEQERAFTVGGARAIRDGADLGRVVNARRSARDLYEAGGREFTREATTRRGRLPGQTTGPRLTPKQIYREAGNDRAEAVRLLQLHGYLT